MDPKVALLAALAVVTLYFIVLVSRTIAKTRAMGEDVVPTAPLLATGFVTNFFDTLGIGSMATTTTIVRHFKLLKDELNPAALLAAATLMLLSQLKLLPGGGDLLAIDGMRLALGLIGNFILGSLMTVGVGLYAPCLILVSLLGMNPTAAFPIMMGSCAFLMPVASTRFLKAEKYDPKAALGFLFGGIPAVLIAAFIVKSLPLGVVRWLVIVVVVYTATTMLHTAMKESGELRAARVPA